MKFEIDPSRVPLGHDYEPKAVVVLDLSVAKVDRYWARQDRFGYVAPGGQGAKGGKYVRAMDWLKTSTSTWMPTLSAWPNLPGHIKFDDGRHRFAAWRDLGNLEMPFCVPLECAAVVSDHFA